MHVWVVLKWLVVTSVYLKKSCIHTKPLTSCLLKRRSLITSLFFLQSSQQGLQCVLWHATHVGATVFEKLLLREFCVPAHSYGLDIVVQILRIWQPYVIRKRCKPSKSEVLYHLTRVESQATTMVGDPQGYICRSSVILARLMMWLTQLAGRPNSVLPWINKYNHSLERSCATYSRSCFTNLLKRNPFFTWWPIEGLL